ncbi:MAG: GNAT family N-acetyltransferase [Lachnospiraceae bacterium]|nr:GNAT family N-acetyltransferase [Lachnospiraceae bacterium]
MTDTYVDERDYELLEGDKYTFFVLKRIMGGACKLLLSDHERLILCFTGHPFPVWIWTPDDASEEEMEQAYRLAKENDLLDGKHHFNIKYSLAEYFIRRAAEDGSELMIITNMFAYDCLDPVRPDTEVDGGIYRCEMKDLEELVDFLDSFHKELSIDQKDISGYREDAVEFIQTGNMYLWKDAQGYSVASCKYAPTGDMASINLVFTRPAYRRKHYAENLVYQVTMKVKEAGYVPMLYTDADYVASNACYEKIGYVLRGKLCTIG